MNVKTVFTNTVHRGYWGILTLYHMSYRLLAGLLVFVYPHRFVEIIVESDLHSSLDASTGLLLQQFMRLVALNIAAVGLLFGVFGSVTDKKARQRMTIFAVLSALGSSAMYALLLSNHNARFSDYPLFVAMGLEIIGLILCVVNVFVMRWDPTRLYEPKSPRSKGE